MLSSSTPSCYQFLHEVFQPYLVGESISGPWKSNKPAFSPLPSGMLWRTFSIINSSSPTADRVSMELTHSLHGSCCSSLPWFLFQLSPSSYLENRFSCGSPFALSEKQEIR